MGEEVGLPQDSDDLVEQQTVRLAKRKRLIELGHQPFPVSLPITHKIPEIRRDFMRLEPAEESGQFVGVAGRIVHIRVTGKLAFVSLQEGSGERLQAMFSLANLGEQSFEQFKSLVDLGDHLFVEGEVISSKRGELSIMARRWEMAAKAILPLPNLHTELNEERRVRERYLDLIVREEAREMVRARASVNASLRQTFEDWGFLEVETPMLQVQHGGASARPFITRSNAFDTDLYLRIAPELFLKRTVVGGIERVFEINRNFRNEGSDSTHSPEFAMLEAYQAYGDYNSMADLTQALVQKSAIAVHGSTNVTWSDGSSFDLGGQWARISLYESLSNALGFEINQETKLEVLETEARKVGMELEQPSAGKYVEKLWEHFVSDSLANPTFVFDFPIDTSPLVRQHRQNSGVAEKWDLYVRGFELATGYSELVDPVIQRERLVSQAKLSSKGDLEAMSVDNDFLRALEHGMPPTGGMGMGIDRLLMCITGLGIRETMLFPLVK